MNRLGHIVFWTDKGYAFHLARECPKLLCAKRIFGGARLQMPLASNGASRTECKTCTASRVPRWALGVSPTSLPRVRSYMLCGVPPYAEVYTVQDRWIALGDRLNATTLLRCVQDGIMNSSRSRDASRHGVPRAPAPAVDQEGGWWWKEWHSPPNKPSPPSHSGGMAPQGAYPRRGDVLPYWSSWVDSRPHPPRPTKQCAVRCCESFRCHLPYGHEMGGTTAGLAPHSTSRSAAPVPSLCSNHP